MNAISVNIHSFSFCARKKQGFYNATFANPGSDALITAVLEHFSGLASQGARQFYGIGTVQMGYPKIFFFVQFQHHIRSMQASYCYVVIDSCCIGRKGMNNSSTFVKLYYTC